MELKEIIEGNKIIRGYDKIPDYVAAMALGDEYWYTIVSRYHKCWNQLMRVISQIEQEKFNVDIDKYTTRITFVDYHAGWTDFVFESERYPDKIERTWHAVIAFIKWWNENKDKPNFIPPSGREP